jgi:replicative DNA helicase Mcm
MTETSKAVINFKEYYMEFLNDFTINDKTIYYNKIKEMPSFNQYSLYIDYNHLFEYFSNNKILLNSFLDNPEEHLNYLSEAIKELMINMGSSYAEYASQIPIFYARIYNLRPEFYVPIRNIRGVHIGKLIQVKGIVTRSSKIKQKVYEVEMECVDCHNRFKVNFKEKGITRISQVKCVYCDTKLTPRFVNRKMIDFQRIIIQESPEEMPSGQIPRSLEVYLEGDIVDKAYPGNHVIITGILKERREREILDELTFSTYLYGLSLEVKEKGYEEEIITKEDEEEIIKLASLPDIVDRIRNSIAPAIYGLEHIKLALALMLFGGVPKVFPDGTKVRGDINILLVGDPGTAKTQLLKYIAMIAPKGVYTSGKGVSAAGLTAAVVRDKNTGEFYLEAGALVLSDHGIACIDEIDKMRSEDRVAMHEAMEQQTISIAKAGIVATLNARCSILAAANPSLGRFDKSKTIVDNIDLPVTLLSRFDLIFPIIDLPNKETDEKLSTHVLSLHSQAWEKIKEEIIPIDLLKKYIIYARKNIKPKLTEEAIREIQQFYLKMREISYKGEGAPIAITPRQLEALIRLTEARARMCLRNECTAEDALTAINLMKYMLMESFYDVTTQRIDVDVVMTGIPKSMRDKHSKIIDILSKLNYQTEPVEKELVLQEAEKEGISRDEAEKILHKLKMDGLIYEPKVGFIQRTP